MTTYNVFVAIAITADSKEEAEELVSEVLEGDARSGVIAGYTMQDVVKFED